jgi:hypothetical protein
MIDVQEIRPYFVLTVEHFLPSLSHTHTHTLSLSLFTYFYFLTTKKLAFFVDLVIGTVVVIIVGAILLCICFVICLSWFCLKARNRHITYVHDHSAGYVISQHYIYSPSSVVPVPPPPVMTTTTTTTTMYTPTTVTYQTFQPSVPPLQPSVTNTQM